MSDWQTELIDWNRNAKRAYRLGLLAGLVVGAVAVTLALLVSHLTVTWHG